MQEFDHVLMIGFGAPEKVEDVAPYLANVSKGRNIPEERIEEVKRHYELVGGASPYNAQVFEFSKRLQEKVDLPIFVGMRNWHPFFKDTLREIKERGLKKGIGIVFSPFRSIHSCRQYRQNVDEAKKENGFEGEYEYLDRWFDNPLFIEAHVGEIEKSLEASHLKNPTVLFSAHSIPEESVTACNSCNYKEEFEMASQRIAEKLNLSKWQTVYQSRSGNPRQPWLGPDINQVVKRLAEEGEKEVLVVPIGFFCENVEILYDLDYETRKVAEEKGISFARSSTISRNSYLIDLFTTSMQKHFQVQA